MFTATALSAQDLDSFSEGELWELAMSRQHSPVMRQASMRRWLFPADYGYPWAVDRLHQLKQRRLQRGHLRGTGRSH